MLMAMAGVPGLGVCTGLAWPDLILTLALLPAAGLAGYSAAQMAMATGYCARMASAQPTHAPSNITVSACEGSCPRAAGVATGTGDGLCNRRVPCKAVPASCTHVPHACCLGLDAAVPRGLGALHPAP